MALSAIEEAYFQAWGKAGGSCEGSPGLFDVRTVLWQMLEFQASGKSTPASVMREATWHAAKRMYFSDAGAQALLDSLAGPSHDDRVRFSADHPAHRVACSMTST